MENSIGIEISQSNMHILLRIRGQTTLYDKPLPRYKNLAELVIFAKIAIFSQLNVENLVGIEKSQSNVHILLIMRGQRTLYDNPFSRYRYLVVSPFIYN